MFAAAPMAVLMSVIAAAVLSLTFVVIVSLAYPWIRGRVAWFSPSSHLFKGRKHA